MRKGRAMLLVFAGSAISMYGCKEPPAAVAPPPPEVYVAPVIERDVPVYLDLVGQTQGYEDIEIRARVEGFLDSVNFREGSFVRKGELLYRIDPKPLEAALEQTQADMATEQVRLEKATNDVNMYTPLAAKQAVSRKELDDARSAADAAKTQVKAANAAVDKAKLDLSYTRVLSPVDGLAGTTLVKPGTLVGRGERTRV
jgi:membrane fusion protein (multidrug efflux system)